MIPAGPLIIGIAGWKNSGKTTLTVGLVTVLTRRGFTVATIKHAHHAFQIDDGATDSARHRQAGANKVAIVSPERWAVVSELRGAPEPDLTEVIGWLGPCDIVLVEGYKGAQISKIEVRRRESVPGVPLSDTDGDVVAIAADHPIDGARVPVFALDDSEGLADLITARLIRA